MALLGDTATDTVVLISAIGPVIVLLVICWVFWRAARRHDEQEALAKQRGERPFDA